MNKYNQDKIIITTKGIQQTYEQVTTRLSDKYGVRINNNGFTKQD